MRRTANFSHKTSGDDDNKNRFAAFFPFVFGSIFIKISQDAWVLENEFGN
jgi:hypothetical protein